MTLVQVIDALIPKHNGSYMKVTWVSDLTKQMTPKALRKGFIVTKEVTTVVRVGMRGKYKYDPNIGCKVLKIVPLKWGKYFKNSRTIIEHRGQYYAKLFLTDTEPHIRYFVNGVALERDDFEKYPLLKPSYWFNKDTKQIQDFMFVKIDNIKQIH